MKRSTVLLMFFLLLVQGMKAQQEWTTSMHRELETRGELHLKLARQGLALHELARRVSIDRIDSDSVSVYVNRQELDYLLKKGLNFRYLPFRAKEVAMASSIKAMLLTWNYYPTYPQYDSMMHAFAQTYPALCSYEEFGTLPSGRKLMAVRLGNMQSNPGPRPRFFYTSTMHGDEVTGYYLMLRLIDYLLTHYGSDSLVTHLMNEIDIFINPLANPDGTYHGGNNTVSGATRYNGNSVDLNRNYPDPEDGQHPDGHVWQIETRRFMELADTMHFVMSANFHGGSEVVNYPWDTWSKLSADDSWWRYVSFEYADTARKNNGYNGYFNFGGTGVTNGYQWYTISGGRQDYMNYFEHCREVTIELSNTKTPPASQLDNYWQWNKNSLLNYMDQVRYGVHGLVSDSLSGQPLRAGVLIQGHDKDSSRVFSSLPYGDYYRLLDSGYYSLTFYAPGYHTKTIDSVPVGRRTTSVLDVQLAPSGAGVELLTEGLHEAPVLFPNPASDRLNVVFSDHEKQSVVRIVDAGGRVLKELTVQSVGSIYSVDVSDLEPGVYYLQLLTSCTKKLNAGRFVIKR